MPVTWPSSLTSAGRWDEALAVDRGRARLDPAPFARECLQFCRTEIAIARGEPDSGADAAGAPPAARRRTETIGRCRWPGWTSSSGSRKGDLDGAPRRRGHGPRARGRRPALPVATADRRHAACADARLPACRIARTIRRAGCAGPASGEHRAARPGGAGTRGGLHRRGIPRSRPAEPGGLGCGCRGLGGDRAALPAGLRAAARGRRCGGRRRPGRGRGAAAAKRQNWQPDWAPGRCCSRSPGSPAGRGSSSRPPRARPPR